MDASKSLSLFYNDFTLFQHYQILFLKKRFNPLLTKTYDIILTCITLQSTDQVSNPHHSVPDDIDTSQSSTD